MPRPKDSSQGKSPTASQEESRVTAADPMSELLTMITKKFEEVNIKFEEINKHLVDRDKRVENLRQERKSGDNNALVAAGGGAMDTPPENQAQPSRELDQVPRPVLPKVESPVRYSKTSMRDVQPAVESQEIELTGI